MVDDRGQGDPLPSNIRAVLERSKRPIGLAILVDGSIASVQVAGTERESLFQVGSVSKSVTAALVLRLAVDGRLDLDVDVNHLLTSWRLPGSPAATPRALLGHTSGVTVPFFPGYAQGADVPTVLQVLAGSTPATTAPIHIDPRVAGHFAYSGGSFVVLQQLVADITGVTFHEAARELLFDPLGMNDTTFQEPLPEGLRQRAAILDWHVYPETAAAGLWTTPADLAKFVGAILSAVRGRPSPLTGEVGEMMLRRHAELPLKGEWNVFPLLGLRPPDAAGLGLFLHGQDRVSNAGGASSFFSLFTGSLDDASGGLVLYGGNVALQPFRLLRMVARHWGWKGFEVPWWQRPTGLPGLRRLARS